MANKLASYSDVQLAEMLQASHKEAEIAFKELYDRYSSGVHAYCLRVLGDEDAAEDIFQETFIKFYKNVKSDHKSKNIQGFLITIARNLCLNHKRDKKNTVDVEKLDFYMHDNQNYEQKELLDLINTALELVEYDYREAFVLREYSGFSYQDIADACEISIANAKSRVFRAKQKIKEILQPYLKDLSKLR